MCNPSLLHEPAGTRRIGVQINPETLTTPQLHGVERHLAPDV
jgi:hypothetical protein